MSLFRNLKLVYKNFSLIVLALVMLIAVGVVGYNYTTHMAKNSTIVYKDLMQPNDAMSWIRINLRATSAFMLETMRTKDTVKSQKLNEQIKAKTADNQEQLVQLEKANMDPTQIELLKKFKERFAAYGIERDKAIELGVVNKDDEAYDLFTSKVSGLLEDSTSALDELMAYSSNKADKINEENEKNAATANIILIGTIVAAVVLLTIVGTAITNMITRPVKKLQELMNSAESGDLTVQGDYNAKDEIGQLNRSFNGMLTAFKDTVSRILTAADSVSASAQQISASTEEIASGSTSQAQSAQTMNELFKELSTAIDSVARSAEHASELSNQTMDLAKEGGTVVNTSIRGMDVLNQQMSRLEEDSNKIGEIIEVIDDIAEQTNLLALNAAIEAARAGDQGRGFAVVADEVRKLAERSGEATKQITSIIKGMQANTLQSVKAVGEGVSSSQKTGEAFETIIAMINESNNKVLEIAAASEQQAAQSSEVLNSIETISAATEESSASSEETAAAAQSLAHLAEELNSTVSVFKIR
jgi:methyl-accepting chemotaxis protein